MSKIYKVECLWQYTETMPIKKLIRAFNHRQLERWYIMDQSNAEIKQLLQEILSVLKLANAEAISKAKETILKSEKKKKIYELCDGKHTVGDIASELLTTQPNVSQHLSSLLELGLVLYDERGGKKYYFKSLE